MVSFKVPRGQGKESPFSLLIYLSQMLNRAKEGGFFLGFKVGGRGGEGLELTHLLIAIDNLIFYDANLGPLEYLSWTLV